MRLKSLRLFGFKSFAERTELIFPPGITAIVGPNGSGKSNIFDAISWVLGERSAKALRSPKAADLLFAGNGKAKPASLAEVSLALELDGSNGDNELLSSALSELVISRRLKRSGESTFFINRVPCRLKDVEDLLLDLGLSADSYAIIGQAEIDRLVLLTPQERRTLIEQVAGVFKFQLRHEGTLDKLKHTETNLTRLLDLTAELDRQKEDLTEQVEKAKRYQQLLQRQGELQISLLGWEYQVRCRRVERLKDERCNLQNLISELEGKMTRLQTERQASSEQLSQLEESLKVLQIQASQALEDLKVKESEVAICSERQHHLSLRCQQIEQQISIITERRQRVVSDLEEIDRQLKSLTAQAHTYQQQAKTLEIHRNECQQLISTLEAKLQDALDDHFEAERVLTEYRSQTASFEPLFQTLRAREADLKRELDEIQTQLSNLQRQNDELLNQSFSIVTEDEKLKTTTYQLLDQVSEQEQIVESLKRKLDETKGQLVASRARLATLEEMDISFANVPHGARAVLLAVRDGKLKGDFRLLAHLLSVPEGLEIAYESALGAAANYLIASKFEEVQTAIDFLKTNNSGRATFIAVDFLKELGFENSERRSESIGFEGVIGWASELVQITEKHFKQAVTYALRNILLVEDLPTARSLAKKLRGIRFVTRFGEVVSPSGTVSGGSTVQGAGNIFIRQREKQQLNLIIQKLEAKSCELETNLKVADGKIADIRNELTQTQQRRQKYQHQIEQITSELNRLQKEEEKLRQDLQQLSAEEKRLKQEVKQLQQDAEFRAAQLKNLADERDKAQQRLKELQQSISDATRKLDELNQRWQQTQMLADKCQTQIEYWQRRLEELSETKREFEQQMNSLASERETITNELTELSTRLPELKKQLTENIKMRQQTESALESWHERRKLLSQNQNELEQQLQHLTAQRNELSQELHRCEVRLTQAETEKTEIERRLTEEFNISTENALVFAQRLEQKQTAVDELDQIRQEISTMGEVKLGVLDEYERLNERIFSLNDQIADLQSARLTLLSNLEKLEQRFKERFKEALQQVSDAFNEIVKHFWPEGKGRLVLNEAPKLNESGVDVKVQLPGKPEQDLLSLSGGEKALVGLCLVFSLLKINPVPFILLDEVDAQLDDSNTEKLIELLKKFAHLQFLIVTHNPDTMQAADHLYGVTVEDLGISKVLSLSLKEAISWTDQVTKA